MGIIHVLDKHTANLIAAGEVVERPASAVKEMLENCADAGATSVTVEIKDGGTSFIRITDNGCGMAREDACTAIKRHATSKIKDGGDLAAIGTLGFRGEALAAISAVSRVRIMTKRAEDESGTLFVAHFGEVLTTEDAGCPDGTTIIVEDIFENTPARRKFLKKNQTEATAVFAVCEKFALSRPEIAVKFLSDGNTKLDTPGNGKLKDVIYATLGRDFAAAILPVDYSYAGVRVHGYIGKPETCRPNRNMQNFFVNGRYIKSRTMLAALEEGFRAFCPTGKFPACVLFTELDLRLVDVNIHPAKLEIKFSDERNVFDALYFGVKNALNRGISSSFDFDMAEGDDVFDEVKKTPVMPAQTPKISPAPMFGAQKNVPENVITDIPARSELPKEIPTAKIPEMPELRAVTPADKKALRKDSGTPFARTENFAVSGTFPHDKPSYETTFSPTEQAKAPSSELKITENAPLFTEPVRQEVQKNVVYTQEAFVDKKDFIKTEYLGEVFHTYLVVERGDKMYLIDKHAAHERIIYERIKHAADRNEAQYLLSPESVTLTPKEFDAVRSNSAYFADIGFEFEEFGADTYLIRSQPSSINRSDIRDVFTFLAGKLAEGNPKSAGEIFDRALFTAACKAAIKAGNLFTDADNKRICTEIFENDAVLYCPHGRPVLVEFTKQRIEKLFSRT